VRRRSAVKPGQHAPTNKERGARLGVLILIPTRLGLFAGPPGFAPGSPLLVLRPLLVSSWPPPVCLAPVLRPLPTFTGPPAAERYGSSQRRREPALHTRENSNAPNLMRSPLSREQQREALRSTSLPTAAWATATRATATHLEPRAPSLKVRVSLVAVPPPSSNNTFSLDLS
jgi:hypothetical protein